MKTKLTKEEKEILECFEKGEWFPVADLPKRKKELAESARNTLRKDKRLNMLIASNELLGISQIRGDHNDI
jgi:predicted DNA binding CopG/RHH family protein